jgi:hypothetical protein
MRFLEKTIHQRACSREKSTANLVLSPVRALALCQHHSRPDRRDLKVTDKKASLMDQR